MEIFFCVYTISTPTKFTQTFENINGLHWLPAPDGLDIIPMSFNHCIITKSFKRGLIINQFYRCRTQKGQIVCPSSHS